MAKHEIAITSEKESLGYIVGRFEKASGITLKKKRPYGQLLTGLRFASEGLCNMILPSSAFYHLEQRGELSGYRIIEPEVQREVYLAVDSRKPLRLRTLKIMDLVRECMEKEAAEGRWVGTPVQRGQ